MCIRRYHTCRNSSIIRAVNIDKETDVSIWVGGRRRLKHGGWDNYFPTFKEAREHIVDKARLNLEGCIKRLKEAENHLHKCQAITGPATK